MKNRITLPFDSGPRRGDDPDRIVENLVFDASGALVPAAGCTWAGLRAGVRPVAARRSRSGATLLFMLDGMSLSVTGAGVDRELGVLPARLLTVADTGRSLVFMTEAGPWTVECHPDDTFTVAGGAPRLPAVAFHAAYSSTYTAVTQPLTLTGGYVHWRGPLSDADSALAGAALHGALADCGRRASADGLYTAPVMAWYHVTDASGRVLHRSQPVILAPAGYVAPGAVEATVAQSGGVYCLMSALTVRLASFTVEVSVAADEAMGGASVEVYMSGPLDPVGYGGRPGTLFAGTAAGAGILRLTPAAGAGRLAEAVRMFDRRGKAGRLVARLPAGTTARVRIAATAVDPPSSRSALTSLLKGAPDREPLALWQTPHSWSAGASCVTGDMVSWGDITPLHALPQGLSSMAVARSRGEAWSAVTRVTLDLGDGATELLSTAESGTADAPVTLSPMVSYPHPAAVRMEIELTLASGTRRLTLPLQPSPEGMSACYCSPGLLPVDIMASGEPVATPLAPVVKRCGRRRCGLLLSARADNPFAPLSELQVTPGDITAIVPAVRSSSTWDFARRHLYTLGSAGVHAVAVSGAMEVTAAHLIDTRPVDDVGKVARTPDGVYFISSGQLLRLTGSHTAVEADEIGADAVAWLGDTGELWCLVAGTAVTVMDRKRRLTTRSLPACGRYSMLASGGRLVLYSPVSVSVAPGRGAPLPVTLRLRSSLSRHGVPMAVKAVEVVMSAAEVSLTVGLYGDNGSRCPGLIASVSVEGVVNAPITVPVVFPCPFYYFTAAASDPLARRRLRLRHDFEYWAATCVTIRDKLSGCDVRFRLNRPQRRVLSILERQRAAGEPLRLIMLKARQWGGSTLVLMYMAWIQCCLRRNWHSLICAHVKDTSATIRGMYAKMLADYPAELWDGEEKPEFRAFERSLNTRVIPGRDCRVTLGSSEKQEAVRGSDFAMAHLSEVAFWSDTDRRSPEGFIRAICGGVARVECSLIVLESTANGVGNYFHTEWLRSRRGESDKEAVFVPWYEIDIYRAPVRDAAALWRSMDAYEMGLWERGCTLEQIKWYHDKRREYGSRQQMAAEFPTDDVEAFASTSRAVFATEAVERLRLGCREPAAMGELDTRSPVGPGALIVNGFRTDPLGRMKVWKEPVMSRGVGDRYVVTVDIGGRSERSDYSVISVLDTRGEEGRHEIVAQWRGHIDHDLLTWKAAAVAQWYDEALLVIESNTLETEGTDNSLYSLSELNYVYRNLYYRVARDRLTLAPETRVGFHTNRSTKAMVITHLIAMVRDGGYVERDTAACDELALYECDSSGRYAARAGYHDDILMTRAIGLYVASQLESRL